MSRRDQLDDFVNRNSEPVYLTSKADIIDYYKDKFGEKAWKSELVQSISGSTDKKSKEYRSAIRDFQGDRLEKPGKPGRYEAIGQQLPPVSRTPNGSSITVTVEGEQANGRGGTRHRSITATFTGSDAYDFVNNPSFDKIYERFMPGGASLFGGDDGDDGDEDDGEIDADYVIVVGSVS